MIHLFRPSVGTKEERAVRDVLRSRWLGPGPKVAELERRLKERLGVEVLTIASATDGLFLSMELLGVGPGDEVIIPAIHFVGAASAVLARGATVVPCDVNPYTLNTSAQLVESKITKRTKAVMVLHYGGLPCDVKAICELGIPVVEDAALAWDVEIVGDIGIWSFDVMKVITTGGSGGAIYVRGGLDRARTLTRLGISQQHGLDSGSSHWWEYTLIEPGRLSEMNDVQAAVGLVQMDRLDSILAKRRRLANLYTEELIHYVKTPPAMIAPAFYWIQTPRRNWLAQYLRNNNVYTSFKYWPIHRALNIPCDCPMADYAAKRTLLLPLHAELREGDVWHISRLVRDFVKNEGRME